MEKGKPGPRCPPPLSCQSPPISPLAGLGLYSHPSSPTSPRSPTSPGPAARNKVLSPFARFRQLENDQATSSPGSHSSPIPPMPSRGTSLYRNSSLPASPRPTAPGQSLGAVAARSGSGAKEMILMWVQNRIRDYPIPMTNFSTCWNDGLAFCALIHVFYPENFDWYALKAENRRHNFTLGFEKAEELAGIYPLLEVDDMVRFKKPDWKCVFTYVQSYYRRFRDGRSPPKTGPTIPSHAPVTLSAVALAVAESQEAENKGRQIVEQVRRDKTVTTHGRQIVEQVKEDKTLTTQGKQIVEQVKEDITVTTHGRQNVEHVKGDKTVTTVEQVKEDKTVTTQKRQNVEQVTGDTAVTTQGRQIVEQVNGNERVITQEKQNVATFKGDKTVKTVEPVMGEKTATRQGTQIVEQAKGDKTVTTQAKVLEESQSQLEEFEEKNKAFPTKQSTSLSKIKPQPLPLESINVGEAPLNITETQQNTQTEDLISPKQVSNLEEDQLTISTKSSSLSPTRLSPSTSTSSRESWKSCRSKSLSSDHTTGDEREKQEKKYSFNHPLPSAPPPIVSFD